MVNISNLVNNRAGLLYDLKQVHSIPGLPNIYRYLAIIRLGSEDSVSIATGSGFSVLEEKAKWSAIGEVVERYCAAVVSLNQITASYSNLFQKALNPLQITRLTPEQYKNQVTYRNPSVDTVLNWVQGKDLLTFEEILLPVDIVLQSLPTYQPIREIISTGLACGQTLENSITTALCECIERDAFTIFWLFKKINFEIDYKNLIGQQDINKLLIKAKNSNLQVRIFDISNEFGAPTVISVVQEKGKSGFYIGCASGLDYQTSVVKSLTEGIAGYTIIFEKCFFYGVDIPKTIEEILGLEDGALFYMTGKGDFILNDILNKDHLVKSINELLKLNTKSIEELLRTMNKLGHKAYFVELTTNDFLKAGLNVVRVITPTLAYLSFEQPLLNCSRINYYLDNGFSLNTMPHPMP